MIQIYHYNEVPDVNERFRLGYVIYEDPKYKYVLELWGASTKHPDCVFHYSDFHNTNLLPDEQQIFQWLLECASRLTFNWHSYNLAQFAIEFYEENS